MSEAPASSVAWPPRQALARAVGLTAFVYGYPLLESMRTCVLQTAAPTAGDAPGTRAGIDEPMHWAGPTQASNRDIVTPANDLMYTTAWINLAAGPRWLQVPASAAQPERYFVLALYDAYTENFENLGPRNCRPDGERVLLVGPDDATPLPPGARAVRAPTNLVWLIARVLVVDADDLPRARLLQQMIAIEPLAGSAAPQRPACVTHWVGGTTDPIAAVDEQGQAPAEVARSFFGNLSRALAEAPGNGIDRGLLAWFGQGGFRPGAGFDFDALDAGVQTGLVAGLSEGVALVASSSRHRQAKPWTLSWRNGRYGSDYLMRALVAYIGLGALVPEEALYAAGHFDADGQLLDGRQHYALHFEPGDWPPAQAFWSVTLYDADRFLFPNPRQRHAIGDRTRGLRRDADGGLTIHVSHQPPEPAPALDASGLANAVQLSNWLPAPPGRFYLILRLYYPGDGVRGWRVPPMKRLATR